MVRRCLIGFQKYTLNIFISIQAPSNHFKMVNVQDGCYLPANTCFKVDALPSLFI
jgi:hypothetical protein